MAEGVAAVYTQDPVVAGAGLSQAEFVRFFVALTDDVLMLRDGEIMAIHADSPVLALERLALMVLRTGTRHSRWDVLDYAGCTTDLIVQVGRKAGRRGVLEVSVPALQKLER